VLFGFIVWVAKRETLKQRGQKQEVTSKSNHQLQVDVKLSVGNLNQEGMAMTPVTPVAPATAMSPLELAAENGNR